MNNGLNGRYGRGLESWNTARSLASDLIECFFGSNKPMSEILDDYDFTFPSVSEIKKAVNEVVFQSGRDKIDTLARSIMAWSDWTVPFGKDAMSEVTA